jgi:hypothetical protein
MMAKKSARKRDKGPPAGHMQAGEGGVAGTPVEPPPASVPAPVGRPSKYTPELAATICARLADGQSLREICREDSFPDRVTVLRWVFSNEEFRHQYEQARQVASETMMDEIKDIADDSSNDYMERLDRDGMMIGWRENGDSTKRAQLRITTRQWIAERMAPKRWGAKQQVTHQNPDGTPVGQTIDPRTLSPEAREALAEALRAAIREGSVDASYEEGEA